MSRCRASGQVRWTGQWTDQGQSWWTDQVDRADGQDSGQIRWTDQVDRAGGLIRWTGQVDRASGQGR